jgi:hypothetical protein
LRFCGSTDVLTTGLFAFFDLHPMLALWKMRQRGQNLQTPACCSPQPQMWQGYRGYGQYSAVMGLRVVSGAEIG